MKTLKNHQILFDAECPMCRIYTNAFVNSGLLDKEGRVAYQEYPLQGCPQPDWQRAANEIALIDTRTGEITYGIQSLFKVCAVAFPALRHLFSFRPFIWMMTRLYAFISYNRRVIIPAPVQNNSFSLQPGFNKTYRIAYLIFTWMVTAYILTCYGKLMNGILPAGPVLREYALCGGQVIFQGLIVSRLNKDKAWDYLGNMMTISLAGALLLLPVLIASLWITPGALFSLAWFSFVLCLMLLEHVRRIKLINVNPYLTLSWITYRMIALLFILNLV